MKAKQMYNLDLLLTEIKEITKRVFKDNLIGIYVHGSIAFGCFNPEKSDVDYIAVIRRPLSEEERIEYIKEIYRVNKSAPEKGIEMSVVLLEHTKKFKYPTPYELHFSNSYLNDIENDLKQYCKIMCGVDYDLAAHFTVINKCGVVLYGEEIETVFTDVPSKDYFDSIIRDIENAKDDIQKNPVYIILNLCRVLAYKKEAIVISKAEGGIWGMKNIDKNYQNTIKNAYDYYVSKDVDNNKFDQYELNEFAVYMLRIIKNNMGK